MLEGYEKSVFSTDAVDGKPLQHDVYVKGNGPVLLLLQELPGITNEMLALADKLVNAGYRVVIPHLFGPLKKFAIVGNLTRLFCMRREFSLLARNRSSPVVNWLKALCRQLKADHDVPGIGVIGMCLTGNFAISLMADDSVLAAVGSQPSMPLFSQKSLHMSDRDISDIRARLDENGPMLAYRFAGDVLCTAAKFEALDKAFNDDAERIRLNTIPGKKHAILTAHFIDGEGSPTVKALNEIIDYFGERLTA